MSYTVIKKVINDTFNTPLNQQFCFTKSTQTARQALESLGYTLKESITLFDCTVYRYIRNNSLGNWSYGEAYDMCRVWQHKINNWAISNGYGSICIYSGLPFRQTSSDEGEYWTSYLYANAQTEGEHYYAYSGVTSTGVIDYNLHPVRPEIWII